MKPLIVCYSYSGHTRERALTIQRFTHGDLCQIFPSQPYPVPFQELLAQVRKEVASGIRPKILVTGPAPGSYQTIFVGSPNWCGTIAPPLASWLSRYDLSGKVLLPFYSHCGGVQGDLRGAIQRLCPKAVVKEELGILETETEPATVVEQWLSRNEVKLSAAMRA